MLLMETCVHQEIGVSAGIQDDVSANTTENIGR